MWLANPLTFWLGMPFALNFFLSLWDIKLAKISTMMLLSLAWLLNALFLFIEYVSPSKELGASFYFLLFVPSAGIILGFIIGRLARSLVSKSKE
jgi:hypothetical protein